MKVEISDKFKKDLKEIHDKKLLDRIDKLISNVSEIILNNDKENELPSIPNMIKLAGYDNFYRIRLGDYRIGISIEFVEQENTDTIENDSNLDLSDDSEIEICIEDDIFWFERFGHRKDFYRKFP